VGCAAFRDLSAAFLQRNGACSAAIGSATVVQMDFRILGSLEVWEGERQLELGGPKRRAVLAVLVLHANEVVGVDRLVDQLWGDKAPRNAAAALHTHVSRLRKELGPDVVARRAWGYVLRTEPNTIDLERFERLVADADNLPARERADKLREALALWRGAPLEDLAFEPAVAKDVARLEELHLTVLENRIDADLEAGNQTGLVGELETLIAEQPLRERLRGQLILALYRSGRQAEALEIYRETRRVLAEELGLEPSPKLRELERAILQHDPTLRSSPPVAPATGVRPGRRRRIFVGATALALMIGGGAASYVLTRSSTHIAQRPLTPEKSVTHHDTTRHVHMRAAARPNKPAAPITTTTIDTRKTKPAAFQRAASRPAAAPATTAATTTTTKATATKKPTTKATKTPVSTAAPAQTVTTTAANPRPVRIADDFGDTTLDPLIWTTWSAGTGSSYTQTNGQAVFSIAAEATFDPQFHGAGTNIGTKCKFPGDFDARVDFALLKWPASNGTAISLIALQGYSALELIQRVTAPWDDGYNAWPRGTSVGPLPDQSGSLRMTRSHGIVRAFFSHDDQWKEIGQASFSGEISVGVSVGTFQKDWQGQDVSATVDNFAITAPNADCPTGSDPRNP
jgi:DNA-binding SARP family transcriptional activator